MNEIIFKLTDEDKFIVPSQHIEYNINDSSIYSYTMFNKENDDFTFWKNLKYLNSFISNSGLDLFYLSLFVYGADRIISRSTGNDSWGRDIKLYIPVIELEIWNSNKELVKRILNYLSGDKWELEFRKRDLLPYEIKLSEKILKSTDQKYSYNEICMFSGGLDSFIGVIDLLEENTNNRLYVSHYGGGSGAIKFQNSLRTELIEKYKINKNCFYKFYAAAINGVENSTRTRSLMFFAHAIALATCSSNSVKLIVPENGLISLNIPLTHSRLGSSSTRTTHPYYMSLLQELICNLNINAKITNPYQFFTKGEMIINCKNTDFLTKNIKNTMSCSHPDYGRFLKEKQPSHCGFCLPCVIRRAAIKKSGIKDTSIYRRPDFNGSNEAEMCLNSYKLGLAKFNAARAFLDIQKSGPIVDNIKNYTNLYIRGINELKALIGEIE